MPEASDTKRARRLLAGLRGGSARSASVIRLSDRAVERLVRWLTLLVAGIANVLGTIAVLVFALWALPTEHLPGETSPILVNVAMAGAYVLVAIPLGATWALKKLRPARAWLKEERSPSEEEQRDLLRAPLHILVVIAALWMLAAAVFGIYNATYSLELGQRVATTVVLGGLVTCSVAYLLSERVLRPVAARALAARPLRRPALPGVTGRALIAWAIGSGIPMVGMLMIAFSALTQGDVSRQELAVAVVALTALGLGLGFVFSLFAARVTTAPINSVRDAVTEIEAGNLDSAVPVYDGTEVGMLQSGFNRMAEGLRERERIRELFGMHVGEEVARAAMERGSGLGGETREVAVLFVDLVGSTEIAAERPPDEVVELLNAFFKLVVEEIEEHRGWVNKFEGDAALAVFGAPEPLDDAAGCALAAGRTLSERLRAEVGEAEAGIGISFGPVVAGNIGSSHRFEYTVIGDPVNEAARLTELAKEKPGKLVASGAAVDAAGAAESGRWAVEGEVELRGRGEATRVALPQAA